MADVSGLVLTVLGISFQVASAIYSYASDVKGAKGEIQQLSNELFALIGVLERMRIQQEQLASGKSADHSKAFAQESNQEGLRQVLQQSLEFLQDLHKRLTAPKSRFQARLQKLKWPFEQSETRQHLQRLERVKTYLMLSLMTDEIDLTRQIALEIESLRILTRQSTTDKKEEDLRAKNRKIAEWLSPVDPSQVREKIGKTRTQGSGGWFAQSEAFQDWTRSETSCCFWLNGITGAGKTTLMTTALDEIMSREYTNDKTAYFYCSFTDDESLDPSNILGSILAQLCGSTETYEKVKVTYDQKSAKNFGKLTKMDDDQLTNLIIERIKGSGRTFIFLDAVNECNDPYEVLSFLVTISKSCDNVYSFISSINEKGIEECVQQMPHSIVETLHPLDMRNDINMLVQASLKDHSKLRLHTPELKQEIASALTHGAQGMFRWVCCQLDLLSRLRTPGAVRKALLSLPPTLDKTYEALLSRIDGDEDKELTREILELLAFSLRPLALDEVCEYLQITPGMPILDESKRLTNPKDVLGICGSLLHSSGGTITLAHHSVKSYLVSGIRGDAAYYRLDASEAHRRIAKKCLAYLSFEEFSSGPCADFGGIENRCRRYPLLDYASQQWPRHAQNLPDLGEPLWAVLKPFLFSADEGRGNFLAWVQLLIPQSPNIARTPPLYYAASFGLTTVVKYLLEAGAETEVHGGRCNATPINIASFRGHVDVVKLLLDHGADPYATDDAPGCNSIQWATMNHHWKVVELFSTRGLCGGIVTEGKFGNDPYTRIPVAENPKHPAKTKVVRARLRPAWNKTEVQQNLFWTLIGLAERTNRHPISEVIKVAARLQVFGDLDSQEEIRGSATYSREDRSDSVTMNDQPHSIVAVVQPSTHLTEGRQRSFKVVLGSAIFLALHNVTPTRDLEDAVLTHDDGDGPISVSTLALPCIHIYVAVDGVYAGIISLSSPDGHVWREIDYE